MITFVFQRSLWLNGHYKTIAEIWAREDIDLEGNGMAIGMERF
jgi:hypothetical protein